MNAAAKKVVAEPGAAKKKKNKNKMGVNVVY